MFDINNLNQVFDNYVSNYDCCNQKIQLKHEHTYRVCEQSINICKSLGLNKEDTDLAYLIALLHDIGRFEQIKRYDNFNDLKTIDHANLGCDILFSDGLIREFIKDDSYDDIIKTAIYNHNKLSIEDNLDERTLLHSKVIRDADKIDIYNITLVLGNIKLNPDNSKISNNIKNKFINEECALYKDRKTNNDIVLSMMSYTFDLYFDYSYQYINEHKYIDMFIEKVKDYKVFTQYIPILRNFVERKCKDVRK